MRIVSRLTLAFLLCASAGALGCGPDQTERGLSPATEPAVPESPAELKETEAERDKQVVEGLEKGEEEKPNPPASQD